MNENNNEEKTGTGNNKDLNIFQDTLKNIIKIFQIFCNSSVEISNLILNMNILEIIYSIIVKEMGTGNSEKSESKDESKSKLGTTNHTIFAEIFALLQSFFPDKKSKKLEKLVDPLNRNFSIYFSEKILNTLISNIVSNPSTNTLLQVIKLVETYIFFSSKEDILQYVDPTNLSNVASKMLDSKDTSYIFQVFDLIDMIMVKSPDGFISSFIREGVIENIRSLIEIEESNLYIPTPDNILSDLNYLKNAKNTKNNILNILKGGDLNDLDLNELEDEDIHMLESMLGTKLPLNNKPGYGGLYKNDPNEEGEDEEDELKPSFFSKIDKSDISNETNNIKETKTETKPEPKKFDIISSITNSISNFSNLVKQKQNSLLEKKDEKDPKEKKVEDASQKVIKDFNKLKENVENDDDYVQDEKETLKNKLSAKLKKDKYKKTTPTTYTESNLKVASELKSKAK